ncbi:DMT family transporter [Niastella sp. OAS944]|uniref:DMT family transporter n=1 Tax=Niastella sp. OAS944 TaxID=2664089 RepID=UPI00348242A5|nr:drug/metabolite transporter (DMT)-like permease [Chitinophagaceae bacterium OAS944]
MEKKNVLMGLLILGTAFWGISFPVTKMAVNGVSQSTFLFYRFSLATLILAIVFFKRLKKTTRKEFVGGVLLSLPITLAIYLTTLGLKYTPASQCAFVAGISVVVVPIIKLVIYKTTVSLKIWCAALIALLGLFIISVKDGFSIGIGDLYTIVGAIAFAWYLIRVEKYSSTSNIIPTIVPMFLTSTVIMLCIAALDPTATWLPKESQFWPGIIYCALFSTAFMYTVSNISQRYISAEKVSIIYLFEPVIAAIAAFFMLNEMLGWRLLVGGLFIFAGTIISELKFRKRVRKELSLK